MALKLDALRADKGTFCKALAAEGISALADYPTLPCMAPWFVNKAVFGRSGFPWDCSDYAGPRQPQCRVPNAIRAVEENVVISVHENYGMEQADEIIAALKKVERAYLR